MANVWKKMQRADSDFTGNVTGKLNNVAAATVTSNAAAGASRNTIFRTGSVPTANAAGDSWFDTSNNNKVYSATAAGDNQIGSGEWIDVTPNKNAIGLSNVANTTAPVQFRQDDIPTSLAVGDIWTDTNDSNKQYRADSVGATTIESGKWETITPGKAAVGLPDVINVTQTVTFSQDGIPTSTSINDIWIDTNDGNKQYVAKSVGADAIASGKWEEVTPSKGAVGLANVSNVTAPTTFQDDDIPTSLAEGDLWIDTDNNNKMYRAAAAGANEIKAGEWVELSLQKGSLGLVKGDVGLGSVEDKSSSDIRGEITKANVTDTGIDKTDIGLSNVANETPATLKTTMSLNNVTNESKSTMFASPTFTGTPAGITKTHVGLSAVTNDAQIKTDGSNAPNILKNDQVSISSAGVLSGAGGGTVTPEGLAVIKTDASNAPTSIKNSEITITSTGGTATLNNAGGGSIVKGDIGLAAVINQAITIDGTTKSLKIDGTAQDLNATKLGGDSSATIKAAAVTTAESNIVGTSPGTLDTLTKIKAALNDDTGFNTTITNSIATKQKSPMTITANDVANSSYDNDPASEAQGQIGVYNGHLYQVIDV